MKFSLAVISIALLGVVAVDPALARVKSKVRAHCVDRPYSFSWSFLFPGHPEPQDDLLVCRDRQCGLGCCRQRYGLVGHPLTMKWIANLCLRSGPT